MKKIHVICVDDSALMRRLMTEIINSFSDMTMVATAPDPIVARDLIKKHDPDVLMLDIAMPKMDGLEFLERLMRLRPMPVVMVSFLAVEGSETTLKALELGAVDFFTKPQAMLRQSLNQYANAIAEKVRMASRTKIKGPATAKRSGMLSLSASPAKETIIAIGASTGGTEAIREVLMPLPPDCPPLVIAQHMPPGFTRSFAQRLDKLCHITVKEGEDGERVQAGYAYIAPGDHHMELHRSGSHYQIVLNTLPPVNRHRPAVDVLFNSVAKSVGRHAIGIILTGMGNDGAAGLRRMYDAGAYTFAQSEKSCVIFGMPREAIALNGVRHIADLDQMSQKLLDCLAGQTSS
ncbi:protein-glutamate methylesterase/protein-glutamine glutaminase [Biostraticola tofi]|uniref:Protein-glutamate methylesterase/protein-glutamine glutaminase n=1 Tax=Biostraticola tofi TaxID=466109 RepID=A0A4R3YSR0_9GAMM|nr:chemotaxis response regulator protein-glutamate methylesterase [Biostraticola tofi]TCV95531.1 two-component system chemotaxis response regulator CheB [Biostraticola tofi]